MIRQYVKAKCKQFAFTVEVYKTFDIFFNFSTAGKFFSQTIYWPNLIVLVKKDPIDFIWV